LVVADESGGRDETVNTAFDVALGLSSRRGIQSTVSMGWLSAAAMIIAFGGGWGLSFMFHREAQAERAARIAAENLAEGRRVLLADQRTFMEEQAAWEERTREAEAERAEVRLRQANRLRKAIKEGEQLEAAMTLWVWADELVELSPDDRVLAAQFREHLESFMAARSAAAPPAKD